MAFYPRWLLIFCALVLGGGEVLAASAREDRAYAAAVLKIQTTMWSQAERDLGQFVQHFPESTNAPMAVLLQAQAQFNQGKFPEAINLLTARKAQAGVLADQYVLWIGEAQFAAKIFGPCVSASLWSRVTAPVSGIPPFASSRTMR